MPGAAAFLRQQGLVCAAINAGLNPLLAWATNPGREAVPLAGIASDAAITAVVMSVLVALFTSPGARRWRTEAAAMAALASPWERWLLPWLPERPWRLGLVLGLGVAAVLVPLPGLALGAAGVEAVSFGTFALAKALLTAPLGYAVTRWVILRQACPG